MLEKFIYITDADGIHCSPPIKISARAFSLAQEMDAIMNMKPGQLLKSEFHQQSLELLASYIRPEVLQLAIAMEMKLTTQDKARGDTWKYLSTEDAIRRLNNELCEFIEVIKEGKSSEEVWMEAGDVANFVMFLASNKTRNIMVD
jgi:NTP pyrophosphatase (non-canonical NTP hydrolase)